MQKPGGPPLSTFYVAGFQGLTVIKAAKGELENGRHEGKTKSFLPDANREEESMEEREQPHSFFTPRSRRKPQKAQT